MKNKQRFYTITQNNSYGCALIIQKAGLLNISNIGSILEFAGNNHEEIRSLIPYIDTKYNANYNGYGEYKLPKNFIDCNGQIMRYYYAIDFPGVHDCYVGIDCYSRDNKISKVNKDYEIMFDFLVLNTQTGKLLDPINLWINCAPYEYGLLKGLLSGKKTSIQKLGDKRLISVNGEHLATVQNGQITELTLRGIKDINAFGSLCWNMQILNLPDTEYIGRVFAESSEDSLTKLRIPKAKSVDSSCLLRNRALTFLDAPLLQRTDPTGYDRLQQIVAKNIARKERNA